MNNPRPMSNEEIIIDFVNTFQPTKPYGKDMVRDFKKLLIRILQQKDQEKLELIGKAHLIDREFDGNTAGMIGDLVLAFDQEHADEVTKVWSEAQKKLLNNQEL